jgi:hypothetical protein
VSEVQVMKCFFGVAGAIFLIFTFAAPVHADPPHRGGLPPGLQKKVERGESLPPGWRKKAPAYEYGYEEPYYDQYESEYFEDKAARIIRDVRDLTNSFPR